MYTVHSACSAATLPADIICEFFEYAAAIDPPRATTLPPRLTRHQEREGHYNDFNENFTLGWIYLTHVCRRWRAIGMSMASLWAHVTCFSGKPEVAAELLCRARECPITIDLFKYDVPPGDWPGALPKLDEWAEQHLERADILIAPGNSAVLHDANERALVLPMLRRVRLGKVQPSPVRWSAPNLRSAVLEGELLPPSSTHHLRSLHLHIDPDTSHIRMSLVHRFLSGCRQLEDLEVYVNFLWCDYADDHQAEIISLERLKHAKISLSATKEEEVVRFWEPFALRDDIALECVLLPVDMKRDDHPLLLSVLKTLAHKLSRAACDTVEVLSPWEEGFYVCNLDVAAFPHACGRKGTSSCSVMFRDMYRYGCPKLVAAIPAYIQADNIRYLVLGFYIEGHWRAYLDDEQRVCHSPALTFMKAFGKTLVGVETLSLSGITLLNAADYMYGLGYDETSLPFPAIHTLRLAAISGPRHNRFHPEDENEIYEFWWRMAKKTLLARKEAGMIIHCLVLEGRWAGTPSYQVYFDGIRDELANTVEEMLDGRIW